MLVAALFALSGLQLRTASHHPMQYYVSLPDDWEKGGAYGVAVVIESANRDFKANAELFVKARQKLSSFIIVAPLVVTNGGANVRGVPSYHYSDTTWAQIEQDPWKFDSDGIAAVTEDVHRMYGGVRQISITGWEAGCHTVWALLFNRPDLISQAALVCPNYAGRWVKPFNHQTHLPVPVEVFAGGKDPGWAPGKPLYDQTQRAIKEGASRGFRNIPTRIVPGAGHGPLADAVMRFFEAPKVSG
jgi:dienelactone hydrolase